MLPQRPNCLWNLREQGEASEAQIFVGERVGELFRFALEVREVSSDRSSIMHVSIRRVRAVRGSESSGTAPVRRFNKAQPGEVFSLSWIRRKLTSVT